MKELSESFRKVDYTLRPAKQVERRMLIDAFQLLSEAGFQVRDYQYTGMGSIHFADFSLFHKFLGIENMLSVEISDKIEKRIGFNVPFKGLIEVHTGQPIGDFIATLKEDRKHVLWLDYDNVLSNDMLQDITLAVSLLSRGSILLVTVDTEPPGTIGSGNEKPAGKPENTLAYFEREAKQYLAPMGNPSDYKYENLPKVNIKAIKGAIETGEKGREIDFMLLFNFLYSDGNRMLTIGGIMAAGYDRRSIKHSRLGRTDYIRSDWRQEPFKIVVPRLTRKEQLHLESNMPCKDGWTPREFEMSKEEVRQYARIYRFFPTYAELLL